MVDVYGSSRPERTIFSSIVAYRDYIIKVDVLVLFHRVGSMPGYINAILFHGGNGAGIDSGGTNTGTVNLSLVTCKIPEITFCQLASATVGRTENEDFFHDVGSNLQTILSKISKHLFFDPWIKS
jgi:hypothetical protein